MSKPNYPYDPKLQFLVRTGTYIDSKNVEKKYNVITNKQNLNIEKNQWKVVFGQIIEKSFYGQPDHIKIDLTKLDEKLYELKRHENATVDGMLKNEIYVFNFTDLANQVNAGRDNAVEFDGGHRRERNKRNTKRTSSAKYRGHRTRRATRRRRV
jgi:hypothetical protein